MGPLLGGDLLGGPGQARSFAGTVAALVAEHAGAGLAVALDPDLPPPEAFGARAPRLSVAISVLGHDDRVEVAMTVRRFLTGDVYATDRIALRDRDDAPLVTPEELSKRVGVLMGKAWRIRATRARAGLALNIAMFEASDITERPTVS